MGYLWWWFLLGSIVKLIQTLHLTWFGLIALAASVTASRRHITIRLTPEEETWVEKWAEWMALAFLEEQGLARQGRCFNL